MEGRAELDVFAVPFFLPNLPGNHLARASPPSQATAREKGAPDLHQTPRLCSIDRGV